MDWKDFAGCASKTRQAFYNHTWRQSDEEMQEALIVDLVRSVRSLLPNTGGVKLLHLLNDAFAAHHITIGRHSFFSLLKKHNPLVRKKNRYAVTTWSDHHYKVWQNLVKEQQIKAVEQLWVSDITYLRTGAGFIYLSLITDAYSRKIAGYHLSRQLKAQGCLIAVDKAIASLSHLKEKRVLMHHSDRGIQYCCEPYISLLQENNIGICMTPTEVPATMRWQNESMVSWKTELNLDQTFAGYSAAVPVVHQAIDAYNRLRPHMSLGNLTPNKAHLSTEPLIKK